MQFDITSHNSILVGIISINLFEKSKKIFEYYVEKINPNDKEIKYLMIQSLAHIDIEKADLIRRKIDET